MHFFWNQNIYISINLKKKHIQNEKLWQKHVQSRSSRINKINKKIFFVNNCKKEKQDDTTLLSSYKCCIIILIYLILAKNCTKFIIIICAIKIKFTLKKIVSTTHSTIFIFLQENVQHIFTIFVYNCRTIFTLFKKKFF